MHKNHKKLNPGDQFGQLQIIEYSHQAKAHYYKCQCSCGKTCVINYKSLRSGNSKSCGCLRKTHTTSLNTARRAKDPWEVEMNIYQYHLKVDREERQKLLGTWTLTLDQYKTLSQRSCFYCGQEPMGKPASSTMRKQGLRKSGLDRVDNTKGYSLDNCVPCCGGCNREKGAQDYHTFIDRTRRRYEHLRATGILEDNTFNHWPDLTDFNQHAHGVKGLES